MECSLKASHLSTSVSQYLSLASLAYFSTLRNEPLPKKNVAAIQVSYTNSFLSSVGFDRNLSFLLKKVSFSLQWTRTEKILAPLKLIRFAWENLTLISRLISSLRSLATEDWGTTYHSLKKHAISYLSLTSLPYKGVHWLRRVKKCTHFSFCFIKLTSMFLPMTWEMTRGCSSRTVIEQTFYANFSQ